MTISQSTANDLLKLFPVMPDRVHPIPLAVDESFRPIGHRSEIEQVCHKYGLKPGDYMLYVGVLEPRKNIPVLLQAYREMVDHGACQPLAIVGRRGWMFAEIFDKVLALNLKDKVIFTGYVSNEELPYLYNGACLFVYPSLYEGFGLPVLEALACGVPVVTSDVSSMPEIVGEAGLLIDPYDPRQLAQAMEYLLANDGLRQSLRQKGLERAAKFSWARTARETLKVYECNAVRR